MIVHRPYKEIEGGKAFVKSLILDEASQEEKVIFYSVPQEYSDYLVDEVADSFLLATILPALLTGQRLKIEHAVSSALAYNIKTLAYLFSKVFSVNRLSIEDFIDIQDIASCRFNPPAVAAGFSGGVDSLVTYINHTSNECPPDFRISHLALFNVGAYGNQYEQCSKDFLNDAGRALAFAKEVNMPLILVDSNIGELFTHPALFHYSLRSTICLSSAVLILQRLIHRYFISSTRTIDGMKLSRYDQYFYEDALASLLSTDNTQICIAEPHLNRVEKTKLLADNPLAWKHLYVCAADIYNAKHGSNFRKDTAPNCGECIKCERTLVTLDFLGALPKFASRFDLKKYEASRQKIIDDIAIHHKGDHFKEEIFSLMLEKNFRLSARQKFLCARHRIYSLIKKVLRKLF